MGEMRLGTGRSREIPRKVAPDTKAVTQIAWDPPPAVQPRPRLGLAIPISIEGVASAKFEHLTKKESQQNVPFIAVIGASTDRNKYGNRALRAYVEQGWTVYPVNPREDQIEGLPCYRGIADVPTSVDRASLYVPPAVGIQLLDAILARGAKELWVNPGSGSPELLTRADQLGLVVVEACSIVAAGEDSETFALYP
jgi:predicted CoA-binding protein